MTNRNVIIIGGVGIILISFLVPLGIYILTFWDNTISTNPHDWGVFGDYIGGVTNSILSFVTIGISLLSLYLVIKIQNDIHRKEVKLIHNQNKPFPYLDLSNFTHEVKIDLQNMGVGTMDVINIQILDNDGGFNDFCELFNLYSNFTQPSHLDICFNTAPTHALAPSTHKELLKITPLKNVTVTDNIITDEINQLRNILKNYKIEIKYKDIFGNEFCYEKDLKFLGNILKMADAKEIW